MRRLALGIVVLLVALAAVMVARATSFTPPPQNVPPLDPKIAAAPVGTARFAGALRIPTISTEDSTRWDPKPFLDFHEYLRTAYPLVHGALAREVVNGYSLLYTWKGSDTTLAPMLLMGHFDVVPVEPGTESKWKYPPFSGTIADGAAWGRGALDDKVGVLSVLEAVEFLLSQGFQPRRTVYLAFGHDEELGGSHGAAQLSAAIQQRTPKLAFLVDEGGMISDGLLPGVSARVGLVGAVEKASNSIELSVERAGGHSSIPPKHTAVGVLANAITKLEENQMPARLTPVAERMFTSLAPYMGFGERVMVANLWLTRPLVVAGMLRDERAASMVRTSTAVTMVSGSPKQNVLPIRARAVVNFRVLPGDKPNDVMAHVVRVVDDTSVRARFLATPIDPSPVADYESAEFKLLGRTLAQVEPGALAVPFLLTGGTDTRHYEKLTRNVFRFAPVRVTGDLIAGAHGTNERIRETDFVRCVKFFAALIKAAA